MTSIVAPLIGGLLVILTLKGWGNRQYGGTLNPLTSRFWRDPRLDFGPPTPTSTAIEVSQREQNWVRFWALINGLLFVVQSVRFYLLGLSWADLITTQTIWGITTYWTTLNLVIPLLSGLALAYFLISYRQPRVAKNEAVL